MARISINNGHSVVDVSQITATQMISAIEATERATLDAERQEAHRAWVASDGCQQTYLETFCAAFERNRGEIFTVG